MARRRRKAPADEQIAGALTLVWGLSCVVLVGAALVPPGDVQWLVAGFLQGFKPLALPAFLASTVTAPCAWWWVLRRWRRERGAGKALEELQALSPEAFERWVAARFRDLGYRVTETGGQGDHGVDLVVERDGDHAVVQCKNYRAWSVGEPTVRDLFGALHHYQASEAYLVTTAQFSQPARAWAVGKPITLWDGQFLVGLASKVTGQEVHAATVKPSRAVGSTHMSPAAPEAEPTTSTTAVCPRCGGTLVERRNRTTGEAFVGCANFPRCRYTQR